MKGMMLELKRALRALVRAPGFSVTSVLTLAVGVGATAAIFTAVDAVLLRPLPYPESDRLVKIYHTMVMGEEAEPAEWPLTRYAVLHVGDENRTLDAVGGYRTQWQPLVGDGPAVQASTARVTHGLWDVLGATAAAGRLFGPEEDRPGAAPVAVLSHGLWERRYGADPSVVGRTLELGGETRQVIGVTREGFQLPETDVDVWIPEALDPSERPTDQFRVMVLARRAEDADMEAVRADVDRLEDQMAQAIPWFPAIRDRFDLETHARDLRGEVVGDVERALWILLGSVGIVLLVAAANVANLFLVRTEGRRREIGIRAALGADRGALLRHFLSESLVVAATAGAVGLGLAWLAVRALLALAPPSIPRLDAISVGAPTVGVTVGMVALLALALGLYPWVRFGRRGADGVAGRKATGMEGPAQGTTRDLLTAAQVALALVLLTGSALMFRSFQSLRSEDPGFRAEGVLVTDLVLPSDRYDADEQIYGFYRTLLERVEGLPGVQSAAIGPSPVGQGEGCSAVLKEGTVLQEGEVPPCMALVFGVSEGYFQTLGIDVLAGRPFVAADAADRAHVVVATRNAARTLWPGDDALGKGVRPTWPPDRGYFPRVVGIVEPTRGNGLHRPGAERLFYPLMQDLEGVTAPRTTSLLLRTEPGRELDFAGPVRTIIAELDPDVPVSVEGPLSDALARTMVRTTFTLFLLGIAAATALLLGLVGLFAVVSYQVRSRRAEMGLRLALGASVGRVRNLVLRRSLTMVALGLVAGLAATLGATRFLESLLYDVAPNDPWTVAGAALALLAAATAASWIPAVRATRVDPAETLREE